MPASLRALALGTAMAAICTDSPAWAQSTQLPAEATTETEEEKKKRKPDAGVTLLDRIDVGAGAAGTAGTNVISITPQDLARKQPADLSEVFAGEPQVAVGGSIPSTQKIYVNGVDENNLAVTVDGSRQNNKVFHHNGTYLLDPALLKAVTIQAGVAPADAGPGALGGSMGFETRDVEEMLEPGKAFGGFVRGVYDTNSKTFTTGLSAYGRQGGFEYLGYINYNKGDNYTAGNGEEMLGTGTDLLSGLGKIAYESTEGRRFELSHENVHDDDLRPYRANVYINIGQEPLVRNYDLSRQNTVFTYTETAPVGWWDPKVILAYSRTEIDTTETARRGPLILSPVTGSTNSFNGKAENRFAFDMGSVTAGFDFYNDKAALYYYHPTFPEFADERSANIGAYAQARLDPFDNARVSFGLRSDFQRFTGTDGTKLNNSGLSGNLSGEYDLVPEFLTVKAGMSHIWGGIPLAENFIQNPNWNYNGGLEPVTSDNFTAGLIARYAGFTFETNIFRTKIDDARAPLYPVLSAGRSFDMVSRGWEIGARYDWDAGFAKIKYADINADVDGVPADSEVGRYMTTPIGQIIMLGAGYNFYDHGVTIGGDVEIALKYDTSLTRHPTDADSEKVVLPGYEVFNAFIEYTPPTHPNFTLRADARNIFDETYTNRGAYGQDFFGVVPHLDPGRSFRLAATMRF